MCSIEESFPGLLPDNHERTSPPTTAYNAISWAVGGKEEQGRWWAPEPFGDNYYWPPGVPRQETLEAYTQLFRLHGYDFCEGNNESLEPGFEKVAIYGKHGVPTHVAKQRSDGRWTSKLGKGPDIIHDTLACLENENYGTVYRVLIREIA